MVKVRKKETSKYWVLLQVGLLLNGSMILINRFVAETPDVIAILMGIVSIILMLSGMIFMSKERLKKENDSDDNKK